jgi:DNA-binding CsgD family transcriptional regulator
MRAEQALNVGLVHQIFPLETFDADVMAFCQELAERPREVMAAAKLAIELTQDMDRAQARNIERLVNSSLSGGEEQKRLFAKLQAKFRGSQPRTMAKHAVQLSAPALDTAVTSKSDSSGHRANGGNTIGTIPAIEARLRVANLGLTERELQVTSRILFGISALGIAAEFTLAEETIATYRKRAYERLRIGGRYELIQLYLGLPEGTDSKPL